MKRIALTLGDRTNARPYTDALSPYFEVVPLLPNDTARATDFAGLVLAGGSDVNPRIYDAFPVPETGKADDERDATEKRLITEALAAGLPVLAICRGMQMLNVAQGGKLIQDLPTPNPHKQERDVLEAHPIQVTGRALASILGSTELTVNSRHHQALMPTALGKGIVVTATAGDVIEAVEVPGFRFVVGVQWHPEDRALEGYEPDKALFEAFAAAVNR